MKRLLTAFCLLALFSLPTLEAQINTPAASPDASLTQSIGLTDVKIDYSRPSMKGRTIFAADGLVPFGDMWRTGANASTKVEFSDDVMINGQKLAKGKYALYTIPNANEWTVIFHKNLTYWGIGGKDYTQVEDAMRLTVKPQNTGYTFETFTIDINNVKSDAADIILAWENTMIAIPVKAEVDSKVMKDIEKAMAGTSRGDYYTAARYYYKQDKELSQALTWVKKANQVSEKYWQLKLQSQIEAKMGDYKSAIESATKSKAAAEVAGNKGYVKDNAANIAAWTKKL